MTASCYLDGRWVQGDGTKPSTSSTRRPRSHWPRSGSPRSHRSRCAIAAARRAMDGGRWPDVSPRSAAVLLHRLADLFDGTPRGARGPHHLRSRDRRRPRAGRSGATRRSNVPVVRGRRARGPIGGYEWGLPLHYEPVTTASLIRHEPAGVVAAITAYNFPLLLLARKLGGVLASGCTAVVLPSSGRRSRRGASSSCCSSSSIPPASRISSSAARTSASC